MIQFPVQYPFLALRLLRAVQVFQGILQDAMPLILLFFYAEMSDLTQSCFFFADAI